MGTHRLEYALKVDKMGHGMWSFGVNISHMDEETYLCINLFKLSICIGRMLTSYEEEEFYVDRML